MLIKPLFWESIYQTEGTVWAEISSIKIGMDVLLSHELDKNFTRENYRKQKSNLQANIKTIAEQSGCTLIDARRANNVAIVLGRLKLPLERLSSAILSLDGSVLNLEYLMILESILPTNEETVVIRKYKGSIKKLGKVERLFHTIISFPRIKKRLFCMVFREKFESEANEILKALCTLHTAAMEVVASPRLRRVLAIVLNIGNLLNGATSRGMARGFRIAILLKLREVRSSSGSDFGTLLHFVAHVLAEAGEDLIDFVQDLSSLAEACRRKF